MNLRGAVSTFRSPAAPRPVRARRRRALGAVLAGLTLAAAGTAPAVAAPPAAAGHKVCSISDQRIDAVSGLTTTAKGYAVVNNTASQTLTVYQLDSHCNVTNVLTDSQGRVAASPQDIAATKDGTLWVADTGDADKSRQTVAVWKIPAGNSPTELYRMSYPSGAGPVDARSLLMQPDGTPIVVTYQAGVGKVYEPTAKLSANATTPMKSVGSIKLAATGTAGGSVGPAAQRVFTGGAVSPDGSHAVLRTFTDAYQWDVSGGDVAKSIVSGKPVRTPLPNEPSGEAITYSADGGSFLTVPDSSGSGAATTILKYAPAAAPAPTNHTATTKSTGSSGGGLFSGNINLSDIKELVIVVGVLGLALVIVGIVGIRRARRRGPPGGPGDDDRRGGGPRPSGPGPDRRRGPRDDEVQTAYIPRVEESRMRSEGAGRGSPGAQPPPYPDEPPRASRHAGEPPHAAAYRDEPPHAPGYADTGYAEDRPRSAGYPDDRPPSSGYADEPPRSAGYAGEPPEPPRARPYVPPVAASTRGRRRHDPDDEPTVPPTSRRRYDPDDEPTMPPRSGRYGGPDEPARPREYGRPDEPARPREYGGRPGDPRSYGAGPGDEPTPRSYGGRPADEPRYQAAELPRSGRYDGRPGDDRRYAAGGPAPAARRPYAPDDEPTLPPRSRPQGHPDDEPTLPPRSRRHGEPAEQPDVDTAVIDKVRDEPRGRGPAPGDPGALPGHARQQPPVDRAPQPPPGRPRGEDHEIDWLDDLR